MRAYTVAVLAFAVGFVLAALLPRESDAQNGKPYGQEVEDAIKVLSVYDDEHGEWRYCELIRRVQIRLHGTGCFVYGGTTTIGSVTSTIDTTTYREPNSTVP